MKKKQKLESNENIKRRNDGNISMAFSFAAILFFAIGLYTSNVVYAAFGGLYVVLAIYFLYLHRKTIKEGKTLGSSDKNLNKLL